MKKQTLLLLCVLFGASVFAQQLQLRAPLREAAHTLHDRLAQKTPTGKSPSALLSLEDALNQAFDDVCAPTPIKGINAALLLPDGSAWKRAHGVAAELPLPIPLTTNHLMGMGSITKTFVSATLLTLVDEGLLTLNDSIGKFLAPYPNVNGKATIRQILSHRSGFSDYLNENPAMTAAWVANLDSIWDTDTILKHYVLTPNFPTGLAWSYSNTNYLLAARIIENITGKTWYEAVRERILTPMNLTRTFAYPWESAGNQPFSHAFADADNNGTVEGLQGIGISMDGLFSIAAGAGCLISTPEDIARFCERLFGGHLLQPATLAAMQTDYLQNASTGIRYGLGAYSLIGLQPLKNWGHDGSLIYQSFGFYFPDLNISIVVQQNDDRNGTPQMPMNDLVDVFLALLDAYLEYDPSTSTHDVALNEQVRVFPNPTAGALTVQWNEWPSEATHLTLLNAFGQIVRSQQQVRDLQTSLDLSDLPKGLYFLRLQSGASVGAVRVVLE
ncbi:MAG: serine hydrolase [Saprospiraceae bacterium]|nr:serine hydrolase [Saprospiraceae bacterium]